MGRHVGIYTDLYLKSYIYHQVTEDAVNNKAPPTYHYAGTEATHEEVGNADSDETSSSGSRAAAAGGAK